MSRSEKLSRGPPLHNSCCYPFPFLFPYPQFMPTHPHPSETTLRSPTDLILVLSAYNTEQLSHCQRSQECEGSEFSISASDHWPFPRTLSNVCKNMLISSIPLIIISRYDPCKAHAWLKKPLCVSGEIILSHVSKPGSHYYQTYFTKQSGSKKKKKQGEENSNIKRHWWVYHHGATWQGDLCRLEMRLHQQTFHFKVWDERVPALTFCSITGSGLKKVCGQVPVSHFNLWYWHGCENPSLWNWAFHMLNKNLKCTLLQRPEGEKR